MQFDIEYSNFFEFLID